jgi:ParB family chromosome partitioning protein
MVGKKRATITNYLRLLKMPVEVQSAVREQTISMGHAKVLMGVDDTAAQKDIAKKIVEQGLSVRQVETLVKALQQPKSISNKPLPVGGEIQELMILLKDAFDKHLRGQVSIKTTPDGNIRATIDLKSSEDIQFMIAKLTDD